MPAARLSVVVPFYNVERYVQVCLDSLLAQTRPIDEILLIDDGSTDDSVALVERYTRAYPGMKMLRGPRRGVAAARNVGLEHASGDWVAFVDADDWAEPDLYERLGALMEEHDLDLALCNARYHFEGREPDRPIYGGAPLAGPVSGAAWLAHKLESRDFLHAVWMHLYRRAFIEANHLRFTEGLMHEDVTWTTRALMLAKRVAYTDAPLYAYRRQPRNFTVAALDERLVRVIDTAMTDARMLEEMANGAADARLARAVRWQLVDGGFSVFHKIRRLSSVELRRAQSRKVFDEGFFYLLWRNTMDFRQKRKVLSRLVRAFLVKTFS